MNSTKDKLSFFFLLFQMTWIWRKLLIVWQGMCSSCTLRYCWGGKGERSLIADRGSRGRIIISYSIGSWSLFFTCERILWLIKSGLVGLMCIRSPRRCRIVVFVAAWRHLCTHMHKSSDFLSFFFFFGSTCPTMTATWNLAALCVRSRYKNTTNWNA